MHSAKIVISMSSILLAYLLACIPKAHAIRVSKEEDAFSRCQGCRWLWLQKSVQGQRHTFRVMIQMALAGQILVTLDDEMSA